jgi:hypothetical protein
MRAVFANMGATASPVPRFFDSPLEAYFIGEPAAQAAAVRLPGVLCRVPDVQ